MSKTILNSAKTIKMEAGMRENNIFSNLRVKSKFPLHPSTAGPKEPSSRRSANSMMEKRSTSQAGIKFAPRVTKKEKDAKELRGCW